MTKQVVTAPDLARLRAATLTVIEASAAAWKRYPNSGAYEVEAGKARLARERFLAECQPEVVLALLDEIESLRGDRERLRAESEKRSTLVVQLHDLAAQLWDTLDSTQQRSFAEEVGAEDRSINHVVDAYYRRAAAQEETT